MPTNNSIVIKGAREHNLKNIDVTIPRNSFCVITGLSGSGKSSLAIDTLYSEGQRRYVESLSAYARQFLGIMEKPDVDSIEGLSPAICIEQRTSGHNPRSTVGTITEIHDYLRLLFARAGETTCYKCGKPIARQTVQEIVDRVLAFPAETRFQVLAPVVSARKGECRDLFENLQKDGFVRVRVNGVVRGLDESIALDKNKKHTIEVVVDRLASAPAIRARLTESVETALRLSGSGSLTIDRVDSGEQLLFSERFACGDCGVSYDEISPRMFSFNNPFGACETCNGLGVQSEIDPDLCVPDPSMSLRDGAMVPWNGAGTMGSWNQQMMLSVCAHFKIPVDKPFASLTDKQRTILFRGSGDEKILIKWETRTREGHGQFKRTFEGLIPNLLRRYTESQSEDIRRWIEGFMAQKPCPACKGRRLKPQSLSVFVDGRSIADLSEMPIDALLTFFEHLDLPAAKRQIARQIIAEVKRRLGFLTSVGLPYLSLGRAAATLSGGETQRIRLATQIGSGLTGVLYVLDEPSIGLHARDNTRLLKTLLALRDQGNTVVVIEHDKETILAADYVIDIGPGAGVHGGKLVAAGTPKEVCATQASLTGAYLSGRKVIPLPTSRRTGNGLFLELSGATGNNLKNVDVRIPLGVLTCITGVSGSGKSTLINQTLCPALAHELYHSKATVLPYRKLRGIQAIDKVVDIDQSPIGRTPRSNPATYTKIFEAIRDLFAMLPESKMRGYERGRFSFNLKGGRCESCQGDGLIKIEMHFLPDVYVQCEACRGKRYNRETLEITYKGRSIAEVLDMTVDEACAFFDKIPQIKQKLAVLSSVGMGYIHLGQQATTLSGGEAQRIKLATELSRRATGKTLYILDEPTTGLHFEDILMLMGVIDELVDRGNTVVIIEHNLDVIKRADYIVDLGPEGGQKGGRIVAAGTPEEVTLVKGSETGVYLQEYVRS